MCRMKSYMHKKAAPKVFYLTFDAAKIGAFCYKVITSRLRECNINATRLFQDILLIYKHPLSQMDIERDIDLDGEVATHGTW